MLEETRKYIRDKFSGKPVVKDYINSDGKMPADGTAWPSDRVVVDISDPNSLPPGALLYRNAAGKMAIRWTLGSTGLFLVTEASATAILAMLTLLAEHNPYNTQGGTGSYLLSKTIYVDSDAGGAIGSVALLAAGGAGVKWVIVDLVASGFIIASMADAKALMTLSDAPSDNATIHATARGVPNFGPFKQTTANTAMSLSCAGSGATALSRFPVTVRYHAEV